MKKRQALEEALELAKKAINLYAAEIREAGYDKDGFCQGDIFTEILSDIERRENGGLAKGDFVVFNDDRNQRVYKVEGFDEGDFGDVLVALVGVKTMHNVDAFRRYSKR